ncbi:hypothetical protein DICPUDRAFT_76272 [Dictyostelium purpureum]|uniref:Right handed beta helix domain-containing protein n=1 Tax=Dictyostelium purpureum TaxID=5786 RepID=F0ZD42_DICPU|nr:uncharacterized protein DICPUDRAFT_76272 [Dictyostelium purpureum]EGC38136.1 hypothetical protein DICPUDRAFT_76272 [Dictyostelium purpureum]|eukprot:XP_003285350.1 hypothetical protein DICPUDRAFT_76272 [Dictyostelium purpureum]
MFFRQFLFFFFILFFKEVSYSFSFNYYIDYQSNQIYNNNNCGGIVNKQQQQLQQQQYFPPCKSIKDTIKRIKEINIKDINQNDTLKIYIYNNNQQTIYDTFGTIDMFNLIEITGLNDSVVIDGNNSNNSFIKIKSPTNNKSAPMITFSNIKFQNWDYSIIEYDNRFSINLNNIEFDNTDMVISNNDNINDKEDSIDTSISINSCRFINFKKQTPFIINFNRININNCSFLNNNNFKGFIISNNNEIKEIIIINSVFSNNTFESNILYFFNNDLYIPNIKMDNISIIDNSFNSSSYLFEFAKLSGHLNILFNNIVLDHNSNNNKSGIIFCSQPYCIINFSRVIVKNDIFKNIAKITRSEIKIINSSIPSVDSPIDGTFNKITSINSNHSQITPTKQNCNSFNNITYDCVDSNTVLIKNNDNKYNKIKLLAIILPILVLSGIIVVIVVFILKKRKKSNSTRGSEKKKNKFIENEIVFEDNGVGEGDLASSSAYGPGPNFLNDKEDAIND